TERSNTGAGYQVAFRYHVADAKPQAAKEPLSIDVVYDSTDLRVGDTVTATATIVNRMNQTAPMLILDLPIPAGFAIDSDDLAKRQAANEIAKFQITARKAIVYLR